MSEMKQQNVAQIENPETAESAVKPEKSRWCYRILLVLLILILSPMLFLATGYGQRTTIELADKFLDQLSVGSVEGSLQDGLALRNTQYIMDGVDVEVGQANLHLGFGCLLYRKTCVQNVALSDVKVAVDTTKLPPSKEDEVREPFTELNFPIGIMVKNVQLDNIQVNVDDMEIGLAHLQTAISAEGRKVTLLPSELKGVKLLLALPLDEGAQQAVISAEKLAKNEVELEEAQEVVNIIVKDAVDKAGDRIVKRFRQIQGKDDKGELASNKIDWEPIKAQLAKPLLSQAKPFKLPLDFSIEQLNIENVHIAQKARDEKGNVIAPIVLLDLYKANLQAESNDQEVLLKTLEVTSDRVNVSGLGKLQLNNNYPVDLNIVLNKPKGADLQLPINGLELKLSGALYEKTLLNVKTTGDAKATLMGEVALADEKNPFNLSLKSDRVIYPFAPKKGEEPLKLEKIDIALNGDPFDYQLIASTNSKGMNLPEGKLALKGKGTITNFNLQDLTLNALGGKAQLVGIVDWTEGVEWDAKTSLNNVNTKALAPEWAAVLNGGLNSKGYAGRGKEGADWAVDVSKINIKGNLLEKNLQLHGDLKSSAKTLLDVSNATLIYGENRIAMQGILGDKSNFLADIKAPNLQGLVPKLKAGINGNVKVLGKIAEPNLDLDLTANNVSYDELNLQHLTAKGKVTTEKSIQGNIEVGVQKFAYGEIKVDNANLVANGGEANHTLKLTSKGNPVGANLQISGKFDRLQQVWQGQLSNVAIETTDFGSFKTNQPVSVKYAHKQINANISAHCWNNPKLNLCFPQAFNAGKEGKVPFEIKGFDLAAIKELLDKSSQLSGVLNAKGDAAWFKNKQPEVNVEVDSNALTFVQKMDGGKSFPITLKPLKVKANLADNNLKLKTDLKIENNGRLTTDLAMNDISGKRALSGSIHIDQITLKLIKPLLTGGETVDGNINARLTMDGTATTPLLNGALNVTNLRAKSVTMPFDVTGGNLAMNFYGATSTLSGRIQTTESELHLAGDADWRNLEAWKTHVSAQANRFRLNIPNIAKVEFSPNIEATATPKTLTLGGTIDIPWARIEVEELPETAVSVSGDEVIMEGVKANRPKVSLNVSKNNSDSMAIKSDIKINIGNDVKINAYGLKADLRGNIAVRQGKQGLGLYGQVNARGRFASFGQDLIIRKGVISFAGLPSQPNLNIEAIRNPEAMEDASVTAGVKVIGLADSPEVKVFGEPSMSQNEALSYILTGRSLENSGDAGSSNSIAAMLLSMSLSKSSKTVGKIGSTFGLNDLSVTTAGIGDNTKVEASASLTPKFRVKYGVGIFAPLTELTLRYNLAPRLYLQLVSSVNQAVDLLYRFEF